MTTVTVQDTTGATGLTVTVQDTTTSGGFTATVQDSTGADGFTATVQDESTAITPLTDTGSDTTGGDDIYDLTDGAIEVATIVDRDDGSEKDVSNIGTGSGSGSAWTQTTVTADYTAAPDESVWADASSQSVTVTLPAPGASDHVRVVAIDTTNGVTLSENGGEGINDHAGSQPSITMADGESITVESDGSTWWVV